MERLDASSEEGPYHAAFGNLLAGRPSGLRGSGESIDGFGAWTGEHRLAPYAAHLAITCDPIVAAALKPALRKAAIKDLLHATPTGRLLRALADNGVRPIVFKGLGVGHLYYPEPYLRPLGDLDILFRPADIPAMLRTCLALGYRHQNSDPVVVASYTEAHYNIPLVHREFGLLEAHHRLWGDCENAFTDAVFARCRPVSILGALGERPTGVDLFIMLSVHFGISNIGSSWMWLADLVLIGRTLDAAEWADLVATANRHGLQLFVALALGALRKLWNVTFPAQVDPAEDRLRATLRPPEQLAFNRALALVGSRRLGKHFLIVARRLSHRPVRAASHRFEWLVCHPGVVADELGVSSASPWFPLYRLKHPLSRLTRAADSIYKAVTRT